MKRDFRQDIKDPLNPKMFLFYNHVFFKQWLQPHFFKSGVLKLMLMILISEYIALGNLVVLFPVLYQGDSLCASLISCVTLGKSQSLRDPHLIN